ncbi:MAG: (2Fe-2S)-binding protein [Gammaproteobacteria bacterium]|nr:(2Fe-2S)-binding protein [Gammaproteobacteria bacterium]
MYVCLCNAVTERDIRDAVDGGARGLEDLRNRLHVATCCGACEDTASACLSQHVRANLDHGGGGALRADRRAKVQSTHCCVA